MPTSAEHFARAHDRYVAALWRGESDEVHRFAAWLKGCWALGAPPEPGRRPDAVSALGGAGTSIRWYEADGLVLGYIPGVPHRCYKVPTVAVPPEVAAYPGRAAADARDEAVTTV